MASIDSETLTGRSPRVPLDAYVRNTSVTVAERAAEFITVYEPKGDSGYASIVGLATKVQLGAGVTFTGGTGYLWGVQAQLDFQDGATVNNASSIFASLRGVITNSGTPVFTAFDTIAGLYIDNLCSVDMDSVGNYGSAFISLQNHGARLDHAIHIFGGGDKITNLFSFSGVPGFVKSGTASGSGRKLTILIGSTTYYINVYE